MCRLLFNPDRQTYCCNPYTLKGLVQYYREMSWIYCVGMWCGWIPAVFIHLDGRLDGQKVHGEMSLSVWIIMTNTFGPDCPWLVVITWITEADCVAMNLPKLTCYHYFGVWHLSTDLSNAQGISSTDKCDVFHKWTCSHLDSATIQCSLVNMVNIQCSI